MKTLFVSTFVPWPPNVGTILRSLSFLKALSALGEVECVFASSAQWIRDSPFAKQYRILDILPSLAMTDSWAAPLLRRYPVDHREWAANYLPSVRSHYRAAREVRKRFAALRPDSYDLVFFVQFPAYWYLDWSDPRKTVVDIDVVKHLGLKESRDGERRPLRRAFKTWQFNNVRRAELSSLDEVAAGLVCSDDDAVRIGHKRIVVVPNVCPDNGQFNAPVEAGDPNTILFVGSLVYNANRDGLAHFVRSIFPKIRAARPNARLRIVGRTSPELTFDWAAMPGVDLIGTVDSPDPYLREAALTICPVLYGLGTRIKIVESLSYGKPVVSTALGAYGLRIGPDSGLFCSDDADETARQCLDLMGNAELRVSAGSSGRALILTQFSQPVVDRVVRDIARRIAADSISPSSG